MPSQRILKLRSIELFTFRGRVAARRTKRGPHFQIVELCDHKGPELQTIKIVTLTQREARAIARAILLAK